MSEQFEMSPQGSTSNLEPNLSELKREVEVSPSTLKEITSRCNLDVTQKNLSTE